MPRLLAGNSLGVEAIWQPKAPSVWSRRVANLPLLTCRHGQIPAPDGSGSAQCFAQPSLPPMCRSGAPFSGSARQPWWSGQNCVLRRLDPLPRQVLADQCLELWIATPLGGF
jgi:hypothetical protein